MKAEAIRALVAIIGKRDPSDDETIAAIEEAVDLALSFFEDVNLMARSLDRIADCVSDPNAAGVSATFGVHQN